jgi:hypothetical protein
MYKIFSDFFINYVKSCTRYMYENLMCTGYITYALWLL